MVQRAYAVMTNDVLISIPLFVFMGYLVERANLIEKLFRSLHLALVRVPGSLAVATIFTCAVFATAPVIVGAVVTLMGLLAFPAMLKAGYDTRVSAGCITAGGCLGILIPPSVPLVVYAILTEQNIAKLFAAAMIPGILAMIGYLLVIFLYARARPDMAPLSPTLAGPEKWTALIAIWPIVGVFVIVFCGIYGGLFSPTEGAGIGAVLTMLVGIFKKDLKLPGMQAALLSTAETTAMVFLIFLGADMMNATLALTEMPKMVASWVSGLPVAPLGIVTAVLILYIVLGCVMDELSMLLLTIPVIFPAVMALDLWGLSYELKALWFGILVLMTVSFGLIAPPVGLNVYVVNNLARDVPMSETYKGLVPFLIWDIIRLGILLFVPALSLWLVGVLFAR
jgi:tripartite ATP-independent transporter DctM subunit